jgi:uncharacterized protein YjbI with pentapeptide repeats
MKPLRKLIRWFTAARILGLLLLVGAAALVYQKYGLDWPRIEADFFANIITDLVGIVFAILVLDTLSERRGNSERKRAIIQQMGSPVADAAIEALRIAKLEGWDMDGSLSGADLRLANLQGALMNQLNLQGAYLVQANLQGSYLIEANLQHADLGSVNCKGAHLAGSNLQWADLEGANLQGADLEGASLQEARLIYVNLQAGNLNDANLKGARLVNSQLQGVRMIRADLRGANLNMSSLQEAYLALANLNGAFLVNSNLQGANLSDANLEGAVLRDTGFDENTVLPDEPWDRESHWTPDTDMARFTDPKHPEFWRSDNPGSPAYRGRKETASDDNRAET